MNTDYDENENSFKKYLTPLAIGVVSGLIVFGLVSLLSPNNKGDEPKPTITPEQTPVVTNTPLVTPAVTKAPTKTTKPTPRPTVTPKPTSISFKSKEYKCGVGGSITIKVNQCGESIDSVTSDNKKIASISDLKKGTQNGDCFEHMYTVKCNKKGTTTLTAKSTNSKTATASVSVLDNYKTTKSVEIDNGVYRTTKIGLSWTTYAEITPSKATNKKIVWSSSNNKVLTIDENGKTKAVGVGKARITARIYLDDVKSVSDTSKEYIVYSKESDLKPSDYIFFDKNSFKCNAGSTIYSLLTDEIHDGLPHHTSIKISDTSIATIKEDNNQPMCEECRFYDIKCKKKGNTNIELLLSDNSKLTFPVKVK